MNEVLAGVLERESRIDGLKVDTEGLEVLTVPLFGLHSSTTFT